ncbi:MAG: hypothetical protein HC866_23430 [Leptolyngbyaceae cyanobacterium RU_5_1]|nr:hypothetical protein [Leptolyngbyaceae cyanobacterium RU_5_1]
MEIGGFAPDADGKGYPSTANSSGIFGASLDRLQLQISSFIPWQDAGLTYVIGTIKDINPSELKISEKAT